MVVRAYENFLLQNASQISAIESTSRSLTYFLPGRFKDAELAGEAVYAALNLVSIYHDGILKRLIVDRDIKGGRVLQSDSSSAAAATTTAGVSSLPLFPHTPSPHARYTNHLSNTSTSYKILARLLVVIGHTELLAEMVARRKLSRQKAWDVVLGIEAVKASIRIALFQLTSSRLSINPPISEREVDPTLLEQEREENLLAQLQETASTSSSSLPGVPAASKGTWTGSRTGFVRPTLASLQPRSPLPLDPITGQPVRPLPRSSGSSRRSSSRSHSRSRLSSSHSQNGLADEDAASSSSDDDSDSDLSSEETLVDQASSTTTPAPWTEQSIQDYLTSRALTREDVVQPTALVRPFTASKSGTFAEYLWMLRPVFYVLALKKYGTRRWEPWVLSFVTEYLSNVLRTAAYKSPALLSGSKDGSSGMAGLLLTLLSSHPLLRLLAHFLRSTTSAPRPISAVEEMEWASRRRAFWWYMLRGPFWNQYTKPRVNRVCDWAEGKTLLGLGAAMIRDYEPLVDDLYFYTSAQ